MIRFSSVYYHFHFYIKEIKLEYMFEAELDHFDEKRPNEMYAIYSSPFKCSLTKTHAQENMYTIVNTKIQYCATCEGGSKTLLLLRNNVVQTST